MNPAEQKKQGEEEKMITSEQKGQAGEEKLHRSEKKRQGEKHSPSKFSNEPTVELLNKSVARSSHNLLGRTGLKVSKVK